MDHTIRIGTRGSQLALWQAHHISDRLREAHPGLVVELEVIKTSGDRIQDRALYEVGGKGLFVKEIEDALLERRVDLAVHSMKDVPGALPEGLVLAAMPRRADPYDALLSVKHASLSDLPQGARVGTTSLRRRFQLARLRPDLDIISLRGNVDTRLRKLREGEFDAILLAVSGLTRLGWADAITQVLSPPDFLPAIGQGALGLEIRQDDDRARALLEPLRHPETERCVSAERGVLARLEGGCHLPIAAFAQVLDDGSLTLSARLGTPDGAQVLEASAQGTGDPHALGWEVGEALLAQGGRALIGELGIS